MGSLHCNPDPLAGSEEGSWAAQPHTCSHVWPRTRPLKPSEVTLQLYMPGTACWGHALGAAQNHVLFALSQGSLGPVRTGLIYAPRFPLTEAAAQLKPEWPCTAPRTSSAEANMKSQHGSPRAAGAPQGCSTAYENREEKEGHREIQKYFPNKKNVDTRAVFFGFGPRSSSPIGFPHPSSTWSFER